MQRGSSRLKASTFFNSSSNLCTKPSSVATLSLFAETSAKNRERGLGTKPKLKSKLSSMMVVFVVLVFFSNSERDYGPRSRKLSCPDNEGGVKREEDRDSFYI